MKPSIRQNVVRLLAVIITIALAITFLADGSYPLPRSFLGWIPLISMMLVITATQHLAIPMAYEDISFLPVVITMAYLALGWEPGLLAAGGGLLVGSLGIALWRSAGKTRLRRVVTGLWPLAHQGLSLYAAHWSYRALEAASPLVTVATLEDALGVITLTFAYLIVFNLLFVLDIWLSGRQIWPTLVASRQPLLAMQVLPMALPPLGAIAYNHLGLPAFLILQIVLLTIALVVNRLVHAQGTLRQRVQQLSSLTSVGQAMRASLELNSLLETLYLQVANLLQVKNFRVVMRNAEGGLITFPLSVRHGRREDIDPQPLAENSFVGWVLRESAPLLAVDARQTAYQKGLAPPEAGVLTWLGIPLVSSEGILGCICAWREAGDTPTKPFAQTDLDIMSSITVQAGVAVQNALLYQDTQRHASQLATLNQITTAMNATLDPERVLELVSNSTIEVAGCHKAAIYLLNGESHNNLVLAHAKGFDSVDAARALDCDTLMAEGERETVMEKLEAVTVPDVTAPKADVTPELLRLAQDENIRACAYFPLHSKDEAIGVLAVYYNEPHPFTENEIGLLETFANQAAMAVTNARIYQRVDIELSRRVEQIVKLTDINRRLTSTLDAERIFDLIIDSALEGCEATAGVLIVSDKELLGGGGDGSSMVAWRGYDPAVKSRAPHLVAEKLAGSRVLESGEAMLVTQRRETEEEEDSDADNLPRSQLSVPVMLEERVIGAIALESDEAKAFSEDDISFVSQLAAQAAVAIRNARLYRHAQDVSDRLKAILDAGNDGLLMIDSKSRIVMTNTRMSAFWDFARQDFPQRSPEEFMADPLTALGEGLGYKEGELKAYIDGGQSNPNVPSKSDLYVTKPGGGHRQRFVERTVTPVQDENAEFIGLLLVFRDVTEQKELEAARESLTHMIVHDLRSPLQAVMGSIQIIDKTLPEKSKAIEKATDASGRSLRKLLNLVNNLLDLSSMERGEFAPDVSIESIKAILEDAAAELLPLAREISIAVDIDAPDDLPEVMIDRDMVERVVLNLLDNALKYSKEDTRVTLHAKVVSGEDQEKMMRVQVIDNGPGVPDEYKEFIFDSFAQIPGRRGQRRSSGIGLAFCRMTMEAHGGRIWVEDNPDGGSVFALTLPLAKLEPAKKD